MDQFASSTHDRDMYEQLNAEAKATGLSLHNPTPKHRVCVSWLDKWFIYSGCWITNDRPIWKNAIGIGIVLSLHVLGLAVFWVGYEKDNHNNPNVLYVIGSCFLALQIITRVYFFATSFELFWQDSKYKDFKILSKWSWLSILIICLLVVICIEFVSFFTLAIVSPRVSFFYLVPLWFRILLVPSYLWATSLPFFLIECVWCIAVAIAVEETENLIEKIEGLNGLDENSDNFDTIFTHEYKKVQSNFVRRIHVVTYWFVVIFLNGLLQIWVNLLFGAGTQFGKTQHVIALLAFIQIIWHVGILIAVALVLSSRHKRLIDVTDEMLERGHLNTELEVKLLRFRNVITKSVCAVRVVGVTISKKTIIQLIMTNVLARLAVFALQYCQSAC